MAAAFKCADFHKSKQQTTLNRLLKTNIFIINEGLSAEL